MRRLGVGAIEGGSEFQLEGGQDRLFRAGGAAEGETGESGRDGEGTGHLGQIHIGDLAVAKALKEALGGGAKFLGGSPFLLALFGSPASPVGGLFLARSCPGFGLLLEEAGVKRLDAVAPSVFTGPLLGGAESLAELIGDGLEGACVAELKESEEGAEGAGRLAGGAGERGLRVES